MFQDSLLSGFPFDIEKQHINLAHSARNRFVEIIMVLGWVTW